MKKTILTALAAGALALSGAASAQDLGSILNNVLGIGTPVAPSYGLGWPSAVAGLGQVYNVDQYGQPIVTQPTQSVTLLGYDGYGRPIYQTEGPTPYSVYNQDDRDGDGVANAYDRWPDDPRYR